MRTDNQNQLIPALEYLNNLPVEAKDGIVQQFGSTENLIISLISLSALDHKVVQEKPEYFEILLMEIRYEIFDIEDKLDELGVNGDYIVSHVITDFVHATRNHNIENLDDYFYRLGFKESLSEKAMEYYFRAFSYSMMRKAVNLFFGKA